MRKYSAKHLTFIYFSIVALAIIIVHALVIDSTLDNIENLLAKQKILSAKEVSINSLDNTNATKVVITDRITVYTNKEDININYTDFFNLPLDTTIEVFKKDSYVENEAFIYRTLDNHGKSIYIVLTGDFTDDSERRIFFIESKTIFSSLLLMLISFFIILKISHKITEPLTLLTKNISNRKQGDFSQIPDSISGNTQESAQLIETLNANYQQIEQLIERERSFTRYASHELRTPLMIMKGATKLLDQSSDPVFIQRQQKRLNDAVQEMSDFVDALLSLTRDESDLKNSAIIYRSIDVTELERIIETHAHLLRFKKVSYSIELESLTTTYISENILKVLIGNLIKNAFNCTDEGEIIISMNQDGFSVIDSGIGLDEKPRDVEGFGLGLLIVRDICQRYNLTFTLTNKKDTHGCIATVLYNKNGVIS
ncbi:sensor protein, histidine kinase [Aliivibrio wodanis]|uniref:histidine kinase n=1 Tax=Aliivibrio wodanis TaxID=80852 RepID=A0A090ITX8_9GAMM|nr:sensor protein, histidine kinase [Aliivibrio wodanis]VVV04555.1 Sensor protein BasS [Aliivibrio wodanis]